MKDIIVEFKNVSIDYQMKRSSLHAVKNFSMDIEKGKITALVGESGSGKTTIATALLNCISEPGKIVKGQIIVHLKDQDNPIDIASLNNEELNKFRWKTASIVFQGAQSSLNPVTTIFEQFYETLRVHDVKMSKREARAKFIELLSLVNLSERVLDAYPHEISGGMKQRVMIAFALILDPEIVILDEPTTALDVITQYYIFNLLKKINRDRQTTMILLTHDIAVVAEYADNIGVMYGGCLMEYGKVEDVFKYKLHPYTRGLIYAAPSLYGDDSLIKAIPGLPLDITVSQPGCPFAPRCVDCLPICREQLPEARPIMENHMARCHRLAGKEYR